MISNRDALEKGLITALDLYSSQSYSVIVAAGTGALQEGHMNYWLNNVYPKNPKAKYEPWSCGDMEWQPLWCSINKNLLL